MFIRYFMILMMLGGSGTVWSHDFTPTYPKLEQSYIEGVLKASMKLFNKRKDVRYYEVSVYDNEWNKIPFAMLGEKVMNLEYLETKYFDVFIQEKSRNKATYICTKTKLLVTDKTKAMLDSRICSKIK